MAMDFLHRGVSTALAFVIIFITAIFGFGGACWYKLTELEKAKQIAEKDLPLVPLIFYSAKVVNASTSLATSSDILRDNSGQLQPQ